MLRARPQSRIEVHQGFQARVRPKPWAASFNGGSAGLGSAAHVPCEVGIAINGVLLIFLNPDRSARCDSSVSYRPQEGDTS